VDWIVFLGCVLAGQLEDNLRAARVLGYEFGYIVDVAVEDYPTAVFAPVLRDCSWWGQSALRLLWGVHVQVCLPSS
jgi:hypothetical protein